MRTKELYDLSLQVLAETEKAILVTEGLQNSTGEQINCWLPKSQIEGDVEVGKVCTITLPAWLATEKKLTVD